MLTLETSRPVFDEIGAAGGSWAFAPAAERGRRATSFLIVNRVQGAVVVYNNPINLIDPFGLDFYYNSGGGAHSSVIIPDSESKTGYSEYSYIPTKGGRDDPVGTLNVPGKMGKLDSAPDKLSEKIPATPEQDKAAQDEAEKAVKVPGTYNPITNNCADAARKIIEAGGLDTGDRMIDTPSKLAADVQKALKGKK